MHSQPFAFIFSFRQSDGRSHVTAVDQIQNQVTSNFSILGHPYSTYLPNVFLATSWSFDCFDPFLCPFKGLKVLFLSLDESIKSSPVRRGRRTDLDLYMCAPKVLTVVRNSLYLSPFLVCFLCLSGACNVTKNRGRK